MIENRRLEARDGRAAERRVPGNGERGERLIASRRARPIAPARFVSEPGTLVDELAAQIRHAQLVDERSD